MSGLTVRQGEILEFIKTFVAQKGCGPTLREIGGQFGIKSANGVNCHIRELTRKGFLRQRRKGVSRQLVPLSLGPVRLLKGLALETPLGVIPLNPQEALKLAEDIQRVLKVDWKGHP